MDKKYKIDLPGLISSSITGKMLDQLKDLNGKEIEVITYGEDESLVIIEGEETIIDSKYIDVLPGDEEYDVVIPDMVTKEEMFDYSNQQLNSWINGPVRITSIDHSKFVCVINLRDERGWVCPMRWLKKIEK